jgi:hypothetical protein
VARGQLTRGPASDARSSHGFDTVSGSSLCQTGGWPLIQGRIKSTASTQPRWSRRWRRSWVELDPEQLAVLADVGSSCPSSARSEIHGVAGVIDTVNSWG